VTGWFDNHCHLTSLRIDPDDVVAEAAAGGVTRMMTVGCTLEDSRRAIEIADRYDSVWATAGIHPHDAKDGIDGLAELIDSSPVVAVGECGLDYHYDHSPRDVQQGVFRAQIALALERDLALVIHTREAWKDTFEILDEVGMPPRTVFHCFTGGPSEAEQCLERGAYLSFSGIVTFTTADELRAAVRLTPTDRTLVETDAPYLTPVPHRGKPNRPALVSLVGAAVAAEQGVPLEEMAVRTWENGRRLYRL
jgi:TatD DNase family protein